MDLLSFMLYYRNDIIAKSEKYEYNNKKVMFMYKF